MTKFKKCLIVCLNVALLLGCVGIVLFVRRLSGEYEPGNQEKPAQAAVKEDYDGGGQDDAADGAGESGQKEEPCGEQDWERLEKERQAWLSEYRRWRLENQKKRGSPDDFSQKQSEEPYEPPTLMLASDLHYISAAAHDDGEAFRRMVRGDDGKVSQYSDVIVDDLLREAETLKPSALLLTGDLALNGERVNHEALAEKLRGLQEKGVQILVIPGNHDINHPDAATYFGTERGAAKNLAGGEEFYEIYHEFGYDQALSRDEASLSYVYALDEKHRLLLLDSCRYEDGYHVGGRIRPETIVWIREQLERAREEQIQVTVAAHHNLLQESRLYTADCTLENSREITELLESYEIPLYISGHLHAQRIKRHKEEPGEAPGTYNISEIVLSPYALPPCQYGLLSWNESDDMEFVTRRVPVSEYARERGSEDAFLLEFDRRGPEFVKEIIREQVMKKIDSVPDDLKEKMARLYSELYFDFCHGNRLRGDEVKSTKAYRLWERVAPDSRYMAEMRAMMADVSTELHDWGRLSGPGADVPP